MTPLAHKVRVGSRWSRTVSSRTGYRITHIIGIGLSVVIPRDMVKQVDNHFDLPLFHRGLEIENAIRGQFNRTD